MYWLAEKSTGRNASKRVAFASVYQLDNKLSFHFMVNTVLEPVSANGISCPVFTI